MEIDRAITAYYERGDLLARLDSALAEDGADPEHPSAEALAPYDQFHGRGIEATIDMAAQMQVDAADHLLDIGSGIGGPARYFATRFGCRVTGLDLTPEFCDVARVLTRRLGLEAKVAFELGDALAMPFADRQFDGAYSMNVAMNIADKLAFLREIRRVLKPRGWLVLTEIARGKGADVEYPTPWARSAETSFLATPEETSRALAQAGFDVVGLRSTLDEALAFGARSRARVAQGEKPPHRAVMLIHREDAAQAMANSARGYADGRIIPIEVLARKAE
ncbi:MAG TPA: class I SAM-dependent methyltransferase [Burkholderiaceae bacterium]|nr:class I SAM-dependent methyltransferase [Burkholderiaceae bacterium]